MSQLPERTPEEKEASMKRWLGYTVETERDDIPFYSHGNSNEVLDMIPRDEYVRRLWAFLECSRVIVAIDRMAGQWDLKEGWTPVPAKGKQFLMFSDTGQATDYILDHSENIGGYQFVPVDSIGDDGYFYSRAEIHMGE